jgi:hypothetical protein
MPIFTSYVVDLASLYVLYFLSDPSNMLDLLFGSFGSIPIGVGLIGDCELLAFNLAESVESKLSN